MNRIAFEAQARTDMGKKATQALRNEGMIPCVLYGGKENVHFAVTLKQIKDIVFTDKFVVADITVNGKTHEAILKDSDFHPINDTILHLDFQELVKGKKVKVEIPVKLTGTAPGVKAGGKLELSLRKLIVKTTPENLLSEIEVNVGHLTLGKSVKVRDLKTDLEIMNSLGNPIAQVIIPRAMRSAASKGADTSTPMEEEEEEGSETGAEAAAE
ncbi:MAG: 50S ribosomal protein L25 [Chitinophagales bacterium]|nr:50S ribosomal protein L25 [Bacteroidota bacterium]MCB9255877.1 50S ribosomal protein L25 [Chitinophagales bacterium]